jgi:SAM-dependent methyltransferase
MNSPATYRAFEEVRACVICRGSNLETVDARASVLRCVRCDHRFVSPRPTLAEVARGYSLPGSYESWQREGSAREGLWRRRYRQVLDGRRPGMLLDVGAGLGTFLAIARTEGWIVAGTEVSEIAIAHARDVYGIDLMPGELRGDSVVGPFDVIAMWHVIEHVPDPVSTLRTCRSLLHPDGILILGLPNDAASAQALSAIVRGARRLIRSEIRPGTRSSVPESSRTSATSPPGPSAGRSSRPASTWFASGSTTPCRPALGSDMPCSQRAVC